MQERSGSDETETDEDLPTPRSSLRIECSGEGERVTVLVDGDVDARTAHQLAAVIDSLSEDVRVIELDLAELDFLDSTGLSVMAMALRRLEQVDGALELLNVPEMVSELLRITDMSRFVTIANRRP